MARTLSTINNLGGIYNASTLPEKTLFQATTLNTDTYLESLDIFFKAFYDWILLNNLPISTEEFNIEKELVKTEMNYHTTSMSAELSSLIDFAYYGVENKNGDIDHITLKDISNFVINYLRKCPISIVITGNFNEEKVLEISEKYLGGHDYNPIKFPAIQTKSNFGNNFKLSPYNQSAIQSFFSRF